MGFREIKKISIYFKGLGGGALTYIVQFEVEAAGVAHRVPVGVSPPQRRRCRLAVGAGRPRPPGCRLAQKQTNASIKKEKRANQNGRHFYIKRRKQGEGG